MTKLSIFYRPKEVLKGCFEGLGTSVERIESWVRSAFVRLCLESLTQFTCPVAPMLEKSVGHGRM
jgi:hypothetical protein